MVVAGCTEDVTFVLGLSVSLAGSEVCLGSWMVVGPIVNPGGAVILGLVMGNPLLLAVVMAGSVLRCVVGVSLALAVVTARGLGFPGTPCRVTGSGEREAGMGGERTGEDGIPVGLVGEWPTSVPETIEAVLKLEELIESRAGSHAVLMYSQTCTCVLFLQPQSSHWSFHFSFLISHTLLPITV